MPGALLRAPLRWVHIRRRTLYSCLSLALSSAVGAIGRAGLRKEVGLFRPESAVLRHQMVYSNVPGARSTRGDTGNGDDSISMLAMISLLFAMTGAKLAMISFKTLLSLF